MIVIYGATGYTGRRIAERLRAANLPLRLAGRNHSALAQLAVELDSPNPPVTATVHDTAALRQLLHGAQVCINAAGPFPQIGATLARTAAEQGVHYLDIANDIRAVRQVATYGVLAAARKVAIVPACGLEIALADCAIADLGRTAASAIEVGYRWPQMRTRPGARHSMQDLIGARWNALRDGQLVQRWASTSTALVAHPTARLLRLGGGELWSVPQHCRVAMLSVGLLVPRAPATVLALLTPAIRAVAHSPARGMLAAFVAQLFPDLGTGHEGGFAVDCRVDEQLIKLRGSSPYRTTAEIVYLAATKLLDPAVQVVGACPPSRLFAPNELVQALRPVGLERDITTL